jgi:YD repeat-containing protein
MWSKVSGPGVVGFSNVNSLATMASFTAEGIYVLKLTVSDSVLNGSDEVTVNVVKSTAPAPMGVINSPADGATITNLTDIIATINVGSWLLEYGHNADDAVDDTRTYTRLASGTGAVNQSKIASFDPTLMLNGSYILRLKVTSGSQTSIYLTSLIVDKGLKIGNFSLAFVDNNVPVAGIPITVIRSYDSRDKEVGDFGLGWQLAVKNIRVEKTSNLGKNWVESLTQNGPLFRYCLEPTRAKVVTITFPDGQVFKFRAKPLPECQVAAIVSLDMTFVAEQGTQGKLEALEERDLRVLGDVPQVPPSAGRVEIINTIGERAGQAYNPQRFKFTTVDGIEYIIDEKRGLESIKDQFGNTVTVSANGLVHSGEKSLLFTRDAQGRITQISDPQGNKQTYSYDAAGNLASFTNAEGEITRYGYDSRNLLLEIVDARGVKPLSNVYDSAGRLTTHIN